LQEGQELLMEILTNIPVELDIYELLARLYISEGDADAAAVGKLVDWARSVMNPKAAYDVCYVGAKGADTVNIGGVHFTSRVLRTNLDQIHRVFPYLVTCGKELEVQPNITGDLMEFYWLDEIKHVALGAAYGYMQKHITKTYRPGKMSHMSPGSLEDWPITQQAQLFSLFGDSEEKIGVRLTESYLMLPTKSVSGIFFPAATSFESCQLCPREDCPGRRARYDESLWDKYQGGK
jgi:hypothetical protein